MTQRATSPANIDDPELYKALVEGFAEGLALLDPQRSLAYCNQAYCRILGCDRSEPVSPFQLELVHEDDHAELTASLDDLLRSPEQARVMEYRVRQQDGRWVWLETCATNMYDRLGVLVCRTRDITDRKTEQLHLNRMRGILLESQKIARFGSFEYVATTQETVWSEEEFRIYGLDPAQGSPDYTDLLEKHIPSGDAELLDKAFREAFENHDIYDLEHRIIRPDGTVRIVHDVAHPYFDNDGNLYKYIGTTHDITERREMEARLMQAQRMDSIGKLAGGIAHDFNNLLIPILGYAEMALKALGPDDPIRSYLSTILQAAHRAASLTHQILAFGRKQILQPHVLDLNEIVTDFDSMAQRLIGEDIELRTFLDPAVHRVHVDRSQIEQILMNLLVNARDAMPRGGQLTVETMNAFLDEAYLKKHGIAHAPGHYAVLAVSDSGVGMDEATQAQIFEPFFTTKPKGHGTGLGMATVQGIVEQHGGYIWVYSEVGRGTTFKVYLPRAQREGKDTDEMERPSVAVRGTATILVVEDEEMVRKLVCETLEASGYRVLEAQSPHEAVAMVQTLDERIDLLLSDVVMPGMNGKELFRELEPMQPRLGVLFMSGYTDNVIVHHGMLDSGVRFLQKPFTLQDLTHKVCEALGVS